jgi:hypothetical protein
MTETIEVELPGTGEPILDCGAQLVFIREFERVMIEADPDNDLAAFTSAEIRAELARRRQNTDA